MGSEEYLNKEKKTIRKKTKGQPPMASLQHAPEADALEEIDTAISEDNNKTPYKGCSLQLNDCLTD